MRISIMTQYYWHDMYLYSYLKICLHLYDSLHISFMIRCSICICSRNVLCGWDWLLWSLLSKSQNKPV